MNREEAIAIYTEAKELWKKDVKRLVILSSLFAIIVFFVLQGESGKLIFWKTVGNFFVSIFMGGMIVCMIAGSIKAIALAWERIETISILTLILLLFIIGLGAQFGPIFIIFELIRGYIRIRRMGKELQT